MRKKKILSHGENHGNCNFEHVLSSRYGVASVEKLTFGLSGQHHASVSHDHEYQEITHNAIRPNRHIFNHTLF